MTESNRIEFKRELTRELDIEKEVVAFLNYREGGIIYIGIDDAGKPVGVQDIDGDMLAIKNRLRDNILPSPMGLFDVTVERIEGVPVFMDHFTRVVIPYAWLPGEENHPEKTISTQKTIQKIGNHAENHPENHPTNRAYKQALIIEQLTKNPKLSRRQLGEILGLSADSVKWYIQQMQESGYIRHVGPDKGGHWEIIEK